MRGMSPDSVGTVGLVAGLVSIVLGGLAIWLSLKFYQMSTQSQRSLDEASQEIAGMVRTLETLFRSMYSDTFGLVRDSWNAMHTAREGVRDPEPTSEASSEEEGAQTDGEQADYPHRPYVSFPSLGRDDDDSEVREARAVMTEALSRSWESGNSPRAYDLARVAEEAGFYRLTVTEALVKMQREGDFHTPKDVGASSCLYRTKRESDMARAEAVEAAIRRMGKGR